MTDPIKWSDAPDRTSWGASMRVADIVLDRDHTLTLYCEADQVEKVNAMFAGVERLREAAKQAAAKQAHLFLNWNRSQPSPVPVRIGVEYAVYEAAAAIATGVKSAIDLSSLPDVKETK